MTRWRLLEPQLSKQAVNASIESRAHGLALELMQLCKPDPELTRIYVDETVEKLLYGTLAYPYNGIAPCTTHQHAGGLR